VSALAILLFGYNPIHIYREIIIGSLGSLYSFKETIQTMIPLLLMALGVTMCFRLQFINIGAEGQFYMGALAATYVGLRYASLPAAVLLPLMLIAAVIGGGLWCAIPALLKIRLGANETLVTLMMNYIAIQWITLLQTGPWRDPAGGGMPRIALFSDNAVLPNLFGIHIGWVIALFLVGLMYILLNRSKLGYEVSVLGESEMTARYAGMNIRRIMMYAVLISGGLCGLTGMIQASAVERSISNQFSGGLGFTAIMTAWLGKLNPIAIVFVSFLFAMLLQGGSFIQVAMQVSSTVSSMIQGVVLFFLLGSEFFMQYSIVSTKKTQEAANS
jgi:simple sugar transport system permease protein